MSYKDPLAEAQRQMRLREWGLVVLAALCGTAMLGWHRSRENIQVDILPGLTQRTTVTPGQNQPQNVFTFASTLLQQLYRWREDGKTEYAQNIYTNRPYLTEACRVSLEADALQRANLGELGNRTRRWEPVATTFFSPERVRVIDARTWLVTLDAEITETVAGATVKNGYYRYEVFVQTTSTDRGLNPFGLLMNCFAPGSPTKLDPVVPKTEPQA